MQSDIRAIWPKHRTSLTDEQQRVLADWYDTYLGSVLPNQFGWVDRFGHRFAARSAYDGATTLEIGAGNGSHLTFENATSREYIALELSDELASQITSRKSSGARVVVSDCQKSIPFPDGYFDRIIAIHILEHLDNLPAALDEVVRVLKPLGTFSVVLPCEGGRGYSLGRTFTTKRVFEKRYDIDYDAIIRHEHINTAKEVLALLREMFSVQRQVWFPLRVQLVDANVAVGLELTRR